MKIRTERDEEFKCWCWLNEYNGLHREDGPAMEFDDGTKIWYLYGDYHREDGPAMEFDDGTKFWFKNGRLHRDDGPAMEYAGGDEYYYLNGKQYKQDAWLIINRKNKLKAILNGK